MIVVPLTKIIDPVKLVEALGTNRRNIEQPINSVIHREEGYTIPTSQRSTREHTRAAPQTVEASGGHILEKQIVRVNHRRTHFHFSTLLEAQFPRRTTWILKGTRWQKIEDGVIVSDLCNPQV